MDCKSSAFFILILCTIAIQAVQEEELTTQIHVEDGIGGQESQDDPFSSSEKKTTEATIKRVGPEQDDLNKDDIGDSMHVGNTRRAFPLLSNDRFRCKSTTTSYRRREVSNQKCRVIYHTGSQNKDKNHDGNVKALTMANEFEENASNQNNDWLMQCDDDCNTCAAGINMGMDFHKCCPGVAFSSTSPTDAQINSCKAVNQATVDLSQCGTMTAKCKKFVIWSYPDESLTQYLQGDALASYTENYGSGGQRRRTSGGINSNGAKEDHYPWKFTMWKHTVCHFGGVGDQSQACTSSKKCLCSSSPWQLGSSVTCTDAPDEVMRMSAVICGQF